MACFPGWDHWWMFRLVGVMKTEPGQLYMPKDLLRIFCHLPQVRINIRTLGLEPQEGPPWLCYQLAFGPRESPFFSLSPRNLNGTECFKVYTSLSYKECTHINSSSLWLLALFMRTRLELSAPGGLGEWFTPGRDTYYLPRPGPSALPIWSLTFLQDPAQIPPSQRSLECCNLPVNSSF